MSRQTWSSRLTYILTVAGATIGFGATWRFPYLVGENGGGAYVLMFILVMLLVGIPIILVENVIGRRAQTNSVDAFFPAGATHNPAWKFFGYMGLLGSFGILSYYMPIGGWVISYIYHVFLGMMGVAGGLDLSAPVSKELTSAFYTEQIENSPLTITVCTGLFVVANWFILGKGIIAGIERSVKFLMPMLFICLIIMVGRNLTLDGALEGVKFYLTPDFSKLSGKLLLDVLGQVFFALSLGFGVMITLSSHLNRHENMARTAVITGLINTAIAVLAGFMIFPSLFSAGLSPDAGPSLVFKTLPIAFSNMAFGNFFAIVFFMLLVIAALTTSLTIYQVIISVLYEKFHIRYKGAINITLLSIFVLGNIPCILSNGPLSDITILNKSIFDAYDFFSGNICFVITALGATVFVGWQLKEHSINELTNQHELKGVLYNAWFHYVRYIIPVIIVTIFIYGLIPLFTA
ncbi:sodium-dependent transporter [Anaerobiospirillum sp. NML120449]|uniref:sodium-dependent transporter n=1 Tax=Anaerobiospirillum sp. NML120449 TaxID=2932817 RepID=UPI001FF13C57|nr:sodium-dependent transporter [Anaerobiospirillum sp. NML120449]MCK0526444.1 sodium-dependent transporter [Anaerobiospirillum sp. NML120449]